MPKISSPENVSHVHFAVFGLKHVYLLPFFDREQRLYNLKHPSSNFRQAFINLPLFSEDQG